MTRTLRSAIALAGAAALSLGVAATSATALGAGSEKQGDIKIGLLLPESKTTRYEKFDRPYIEQKIKELAPDAQIDYYNAAESATTQQQQVNTALAKGDKVLILDAVDAKSIQSSVQKAHDAGVKVVAYDRLAQGPVDAYVSYDNHKVGELQGKALLDALGDKAESGEIVMHNGSPTDPNAAEFKAGAHSVLDGKVKIGKEYDTPNWDPNNANQQMSGAISALGKDKIVGVYSANDGLAAGIATALKSAGMNVPLTGQDAQLDAIQRILLGTQTITVEKPYKPEADIAATMAVDLAEGKKLSSDLIPTTVTSGSDHKVAAQLLDPVVVNKDNIKDTVVKDGLYTVQEICTPTYAAACKDAGLE
ncbi:substrate-binding domain-containing protein [Streptomyces tanashiensis]|uniref:Substrate-binding domain-containing protein n=1 Tax=Streptomyces tanashiensis TaxID=67367 RepID=A0ABY6R6L3_9ACTN|nr:substrate-binding domain-containing protein [Streptomyces tanashiensis]UZX25721.1 substrate-binding domain-containing protein [Streptomyces tanashiensis]GGY10481.1 solute-binding protein [Streptomyces tanashiensis]